ncbi:uncharacterized protein [Diadema setosum]|uniref:uncharacterized protein n=1 Tax=Diadema setosum TaxID=31175 RepID=UPI003B3ABDEB
MFRQKFLGFTGGVMIAYGIILSIQGTFAPATFSHAAAGVPLWCGLLFVMTGCANLVQAFDRKRKHRVDEMPFSFTVILCNFVALLVAALCIGFLTWGAWATLDDGVQVGEEAAVELYTAVVIASIFILVLSMTAMFVDCCSLSFGPPAEPRPSYYDYPPRQVPAIYKA